jgi:hypothetical protein
MLKKQLTGNEYIKKKEEKMKNSLSIDAIVQPRSPAAEEEVGEEDRH